MASRVSTETMTVIPILFSGVGMECGYHMLFTQRGF